MVAVTEDSADLDCPVEGNRRTHDHFLTAATVHTELASTNAAQTLSCTSAKFVAPTILNNKHRYFIQVALLLSEISGQVHLFLGTDDIYQFSNGIRANS